MVKKTALCILQRYILITSFPFKRFTLRLPLHFCSISHLCHLQTCYIFLLEQQVCLLSSVHQRPISDFLWGRGTGMASHVPALPATAHHQIHCLGKLLRRKLCSIFFAAPPYIFNAVPWKANYRVCKRRFWVQTVCCLFSSLLWVWPREWKNQCFVCGHV